jgi:3-oxoacyl-[acyl-carrier protein] reductase
MIDAQTMLITGAASGIGRHLVGVLSKHGEHVVATDIDREALQRAAGNDNWPHDHVSTATLDVSSTQDWKRRLTEVIETFGRIDAVIHVAGVLQPHRVLEVTDEELDRQTDTLFKGTVRAVRESAKVMKRQGHGHIVLVNSLTGIAPTPGMSVYSGARAGARIFALGAAQELREHNIDLTVICPDGVDTPMASFEAQHEEAALTFSGKRLLTVDEVADSIEYALEHQPVELLLPVGRGVMSKVANALPALAEEVTPLLVRRGLKKIHARKEEG